MAYTALWTNRVDHPTHVEIDLNLVNGAVVRREQSFDFKNTPAQVDASFLAARATTAINRANARDTYLANVAAFVAANSDLTVIKGDATDAATLVSRNSLPYTGAQVRGFFTERIAAFNVQILNEIADRIYG